MIGPDFRYRYVNPAAARHGSRTREELLGRTMSECYPGIERTAMFAILRRCLEERRAAQMVNESEYPDGSRGWFELHFELVPEGVAVFSLDITERQSAETVLVRSSHALVAEQDHYRELLANLEDVVFSLDAEGRIAFISPAIERRYGFRPEDMLGRHFTEFVHPQDAVVLASSFERTLAGAIEVNEFRASDAGGRERRLRVRSRARFEKGRAVGVEGVMVDVTELWQAQESLRKSEQCYRTLFENMQSGVAVYEAIDGGQDFVIKDFSPAAERIERISRNRVLGRRVTEVFPGVDSLGLLDVLRRVWRTGQAETHPATLYDDGRLSGWRENRVFRLPSGEVVAVFDDVTIRRQAEEKLVVFKQRLERLAGLVQEHSQVRSLEGIVRLVRQVGRTLVGADGSTFVLREDDRCHYLDEDAIGPLWKGRKFPLSDCISGWVMTHGQPSVIEDVYADPRIPQKVYRPTFVRSLLMVPIRRRNPAGAIGAYWAGSHRADENEVRLLQALADATAVAMENVRFLQALDAERARTHAIFNHFAGRPAG